MMVSPVPLALAHGANEGECVQCTATSRFTDDIGEFVTRSLFWTF